MAHNSFLPNSTIQVRDKMSCGGNNVAANAEQVRFFVLGELQPEWSAGFALPDSKKRGAELLGSPFEGTMVRS
jgi:hypothetical protein